MPFYERGQVRIHYEEVGSGFPLLVIPGGGLNSTVVGLATHPFNPFEEFKGEFRVIAAASLILLALGSGLAQEEERWICVLLP